MRTLFYKNKPSIIMTSTVAGPKESEGSLGKFYDVKLSDDKYGEKSFEKAESKMLYTAIDNCINKSKKDISKIDSIISGDLLDQITSSTFAVRNFNTGFLGVYNACASFCESLSIGATMIDGGYMQNVICATSSHFSSAERQYRFPLELGSTRPPLAQWTVTGAGACMLSNSKSNPKIVCSTVGKIVDFGVTDANDMGAAMAPAGAETISTHFKETGLKPNDYDLIVSGDLGTFGSRILKDLLYEKGFDIEKQHVDCGELIYNISESEYQGGSGAGCSSLVFCSYLFDKLKKKELKRILLVATGALLSSTSSMQGESIPGIAHAVSVEC
ncbi:MAG: stage V sporulation protein AD [Clostridia bacterium]|nr:stage V sporulation protein AD [Clostridia bacterium]